MSHQENQIDQQINAGIAQRAAQYDKLDKIKSAFVKFCLLHKIPLSLGLEFRIGKLGYIIMKNPIDSSQMGVFAHTLREAYFHFFNTSRIDFEDRYMWFTLNIRYVVLNGGENGLNYPVAENENIYYDQQEDRFITVDEIPRPRKKKLNKG
jgi:hypothetical protein